MVFGDGSVEGGVLWKRKEGGDSREAKPLHRKGQGKMKESPKMRL